MMAIGGWSDYTAFEPSLEKPTESRIGEAMRAGGVGTIVRNVLTASVAESHPANDDILREPC